MIEVRLLLFETMSTASKHLLFVYRLLLSIHFPVASCFQDFAQAFLQEVAPAALESICRCWLLSIFQEKPI